MSVNPQVRVVVRAYGSSIPLGFFAFGIGMFLYAALDAPWVKPSAWHSIGVILAGFVAPLELIATVFAFLARDTVAAATLGLFAASWFVGGLLTMNAKPGVLDPGAGYFFIAFAVVIVLLGIPALLGKPLIAVLLLASDVRLVCSAVYQLGGGSGWNRVGGWVALGVFCVAMYGGLAFLLEDLQGKAVLPTGRRGGSREAIEGGLDEQLRGLEDEAGVRHTL